MASPSFVEFSKRSCANLVEEESCGNCYTKLSNSRAINNVSLQDIISIVWTLMRELPSNDHIINLNKCYYGCKGNIVLSVQTVDNGRAHFHNLSKCTSLLTLWNRSNAPLLEDNESEIFEQLITHLYMSPNRWQATLLLQAMFNLATSIIDDNDAINNTDNDSGDDESVQSDSVSIYEDCQAYIDN